MRSFARNRGMEPEFLAQYRQNDKTWNDISRNDYTKLRSKLHGIFAGLCAYCEAKASSRDLGLQPTIDHFKPRNPNKGDFGKESTFCWKNLMYCCSECQKIKGNKWPGTENPTEYDKTSRELTTLASESGWDYTPPTMRDGYISPDSITSGSYQEFFMLNEDGDITPNHNVDDTSKSRALRTIVDFDLNRRTFYRNIHLAHIFYAIQKMPKRRRNDAWRSYGTPSYEDQKRMLDPRVEFPSHIYYAHSQGWTNSYDNLPEKVKRNVDILMCSDLR